MDKWLEWDVRESRGVQRYRLKVAPSTGLQEIPVRGNLIDCRQLSRWTSRPGC
jgi:hypothetical protein